MEFLLLYTLSPEVFLTLAWSRATDTDAIGDGAMAVSSPHPHLILTSSSAHPHLSGTQLGFLCNLGAVGGLAYGVASDDLPPLPLTAIYVLAAAGAALAIKLAHGEEEAQAAAYGGAVAFVAVGAVAWLLGSGALDLAVLTEPSPVGLPWYQAALAALVLLGLLAWKKLNDDDDDSDSVRFHHGFITVSHVILRFITFSLAGGQRL